MKGQQKKKKKLDSPKGKAGNNQSIVSMFHQMRSRQQNKSPESTCKGSASCSSSTINQQDKNEKSTRSKLSLKRKLDPFPDEDVICVDDISCTEVSNVKKNKLGKGSESNESDGQNPSSSSGESSSKNKREDRKRRLSLKSKRTSNKDVKYSKVSIEQNVESNQDIDKIDECLKAQKDKINESEKAKVSLDSVGDSKEINKDLKSIHGLSSSKKVIVNTEENAASEAKDEEAEEEVTEYRVPYYLENFLLILDSVTNDEFFKDLFNADDREVFEKFLSLPESGQKVYVRLFGRNYTWIRNNKIVYPKIGDDLSEELAGLVQQKLLLDENALDDLDETLHAMAAPEVRSLAKSLHLPHGQTREQLIPAIHKHASKAAAGMGAFLNTGTNRTAQVILKRAKSALGRVFRLTSEARSVFLRTMLLFDLHRSRGDDDGRGQQQLFQMLMSNIGQVKYAPYTVNRQAKIFRNRNDIILLSEALQDEGEIAVALENKDYTAAHKVYNKVQEIVTNMWQDEQLNEHILSLPVFLRQFTAGAVLTRVLSYGVEVLQHDKQYSAAVTQLEALIHQEVYHKDYRGRWYDRLALNLHFHLKQTNKAVDVIQRAVDDSYVRVGHRLSLLQRAQKICHTASNSKFIRNRWATFEKDDMINFKEAPKVTIEAIQMRTSEPSMHAGYVWMIKDAAGDTTSLVKRVEDVALQHYSDMGYTQGIHGEGGTFTFLFCLLFWDQIFRDDLPDVFYHSYQMAPLDLRTDHFYTARKAEINQRLDAIKTMAEEELCDEMRSSWESHDQVLCMGANWERFDSVEHMLGLVRCLGSAVLSGICTRLAREMRFCTGGIPDLVVWNTDQKTFKIVEVKGPGDRLSTKQLLWLDYLMGIGADAEVCHVQGVSAKKLH